MLGQVKATDWATISIGGNLGYEAAGLYGISLGADFKTGQGDNWNNDDDSVYGGVLAKNSEGNAKNYTLLMNTTSAIGIMIQPSPSEPSR